MNNFLSNWWNKGRNVRIPNESTAGWGQLWTDDRNQLGKSDANYQAGRRGNPFGRPDQAFNPFRSAEKGGPGSGPTPLVRQLGERILGPVATGASLFSLGQEGSPLDQATEAMPDLQIGQFGISNNPQTDIGQRTGDFLVNQLGNAYEQFDDFGSGVRENLVGGPKWFLDEFKSRLPVN